MGTKYGLRGLVSEEELLADEYFRSVRLEESSNDQQQRYIDYLAYVNKNGYTLELFNKVQTCKEELENGKNKEINQG